MPDSIRKVLDDMNANQFDLLAGSLPSGQYVVEIVPGTEDKSFDFRIGFSIVVSEGSYTGRRIPLSFQIKEQSPGGAIFTRRDCDALRAWANAVQAPAAQSIGDIPRSLWLGGQGKRVELTIHADTRLRGG